MSQLDRGVEAALKRMRRVPAAEASPTCLSAEVAAAWAEGTLPERERAQAEAHVADCPRCLEVLAALTRTAPADAVVPSPGWRAPWRIQWIVPAMAAATALVLWIYGGSPPPATEPAPIAAPPAASPSPHGGATPAQPVTRDADARRDFPKPVSSAPDAANSRVRSSAKEEAAPAAAAAPSPPAAPPPARQEAGAPVSRLRDASGDRRPFQQRALDVLSPVASTRWRIDGITIDSSTDGGATWTRQFTAAAPLLAGHAPASDVCWIVGARGIVLLSRDGVSWQQVASPAAVDLTGVQAVDDRVTSVMAADGRVFRTSDAGRTWSLQER